MTTAEVYASPEWHSALPSAWRPCGSVSPNVRTSAPIDRLALPHPVVEHGASEESGVLRVNAFVDHLAEVPVDKWLDIGRDLAVDCGEGSRSAWAILEATIADRGLGIAAWNARDAVETSAFIASSSKPRWSTEERRLFARAHVAAEGAALARLAVDYLPPVEVAFFCAPFLGVEPMDSTPHADGA